MLSGRFATNNKTKMGIRKINKTNGMKNDDMETPMHCGNTRRLAPFLS